MLKEAKKFLRERFPRPYYKMQSFIATLATCILKISGIELPSYFHSSHRIRMVFNREVDSEVGQIAQKLLQEGDVVLDVGANVGLVARQFATYVGPTGNVLAFEPDIKTSVYLKRNVRKLPQVQVHEVALSDANGTASFYLDPRSGTSNSLAEREVAGDVVTVPCETLDHFLTSHPFDRIALIKIDVEGAESKVLRGMRETLKSHPETHIILEFGPHNQEMAGVNPADFLSQIYSLNLETYVLKEDGKVIKASCLEEIMALLPEVGYINLLCTKNPVHF